MKRNFAKMQALGNDFILFDAMRSKLNVSPKLIRQLCNRRYGIGADQVLIVGKSRKADFKMLIYNADGGQVEMCGNGLRAMARYAHEKKLTKKKQITIEIKAGVQTAELIDKKRIRVDMGQPILKGKEIPVSLSGRVINRPLRLEGRDMRITCVSMGNPHCVLFVDNVASYPVPIMGSLIENHNLFPKRTNVEFVEHIDKKHFKMRVWERGTGETLACGSGACAAAVAGVLNSYTERKVKVELRGGQLEIHWDLSNDHVYMTGPAEKSFEGTIDI